MGAVPLIPTPFEAAVELNQNAQVDSSQIDDVRGSGGGGLGRLGGIPIPTSKGGLIVTVVMVLIALAGGGLGINALGGSDSSDTGSGSVATDCASTNANKDQETDCRNALFVESIQNFWQKETPDVFGKAYTTSKTEFFSGSTQTGCGAADTGVGPFYCPDDNEVYIDLSFYDQLSSEFGAKGAFAQPYVLAHEYGHHIQDIIGTEALEQKAVQKDPNNANKSSVMLELQADCYAGVWAKHAESTTDTHGTPIFTSITSQDIADAVTAAGAVGDDTIQKKMGCSVDESAFTHGSSAQREQWLNTGYSSGDPKSCDTFGNSLSA
jgi:predicted metalloprotease